MSLLELHSLLNLCSSAFLLVLLLFCAYTEHVSNRVPNLLTVPAVIAGLAISCAHDALLSQPGLLGHVIATVIPVAVCAVPYVCGWIGAGDIKLLAAIGALKGLPFLMLVFINVAVIGAIMAIYIAVKAIVKRKDSSRLLQQRLPYAYAMVIATFIALILPGGS
jgi:prepilin peptidase CpaA